MSAEQKENRKNLVATLVTGIAAGTGSGNIAAATRSAQIETENNAVYVVGHPAVNEKVAALTSPPSNHLSIVVIPDNPSDFTDLSGWQSRSDGTISATLGAQPNSTLQLLLYSPNYSKDGLSNSTFIQKIDTPQGQTDTQFISNLIRAANSYSNTISYSFPNIFTGVSGYMPPGNFNSNSFVSGVLRSVLGAAPQLDSAGVFQTPGYSNPVPLPFSAGSIFRAKP